MNAVLTSLLLAALAMGHAQAAPTQTNCATTVTPRTVEYPWMSIDRWKQMHGEQVNIARSREVPVMFLGDSITEMWPKEIFMTKFGDLKPANFGIGGDHTGNVLYRINDPAIARLKPRAIVLLIGINNLGLCGETPEQAFKGIEKVVWTLRNQYPYTRVLLNAVLPADEHPDSQRRKDITALNRMVEKLADGKQIVYRDYGPRFVNPNGTISKEVMPDFLHLSPKAYQTWADAMRPDLDQLLK